MTLNLDTSKPLRSLTRLEELVRAVRDTPTSSQEQHVVEWKREGDAADKKWRGELAMQVLGMANRDPDAAAAWFGGMRLHDPSPPVPRLSQPAGRGRLGRRRPDGHLTHPVLRMGT